MTTTRKTCSIFLWIKLLTQWRNLQAGLIIPWICENPHFNVEKWLFGRHDKMCMSNTMRKGGFNEFACQPARSAHGPILFATFKGTFYIMILRGFFFFWHWDGCYGSLMNRLLDWTDPLRIYNKPTFSIARLIYFQNQNRNHLLDSKTNNDLINGQLGTKWTFKMLARNMEVMAT